MSRLARIALLLAATLVGTVSASHAAFQVPPELKDASPEQVEQYLRDEGQRSLNDKLLIGQQRYNQRLALRRGIADSMRANFEQRQVAIARQISGAPTVQESAGNSYSWMLWLAVAGVGGSLLLRYFRSRETEI
jgi:hypothetical protein